VEFETQWSARNRKASDDGLKFGQFAGIVQTCSDLVAREVGKFRDNVSAVLPAARYPSTRPTGIRVPLGVVSRAESPGRLQCGFSSRLAWLILTRSYSKAKQGRVTGNNNRTCRS